MTDELVQLIRREAEAARTLAMRMRALELVVAAGFDRFLGFAVDDLDAAAGNLEALELSRAMALVTAGFEPDVAADDVLAVVDDRDRALSHAVEELATAMDEVERTRERSRTVLGTAARGARARLDATHALTAGV